MSRQLERSQVILIAMLLCGAGCGALARGKSKCAPGCLPHGVCNEDNGRCDCPRGYSGHNCSTPAPDMDKACSKFGFHPPRFTSGCTDNLPNSFCINNCNGLGTCRAGWCHCIAGFYGYDCSLSIDPSTGAQHLLAPYRYTTRQTRPWIYVHNLPPRYNTHQNMRLTDRPLWYLFLSRLLSSGAQTADPMKADFFLFPMDVRGPSKAVNLLRAFKYVKANTPWWNTSLEHRNIVIHTGDVGRRDMTSDVIDATSNFIYLTHWGLTQDVGTVTPWKASHRPNKDVVIPIYISGFSRRADGLKNSPLHPAAPPLKNGKNLQMLFAGRICYDRKEPSTTRKPACRSPSGYSQDVRSMVFEHHWNRTGFRINVRNIQYLEDLQQTRFCLAPTGGGHGHRQVLVSFSGCTPLLIGDHVLQPFEPTLDWSRISVSVNQSDIPILHNILSEVSDQQYQAYQSNLPCAAQHMTWSSLIGVFMNETAHYDAFETTLQIMRVMKDYPEAGPSYAALASMDKEFKDFMDCNVGGSSEATRRGQDSSRSPVLSPTSLSSLRALLTLGERPCSMSFHDGMPERCRKCVEGDGEMKWGGALCCKSENLASCPRLWV